jgi:hypothetical protein
MGPAGACARHWARALAAVAAAVTAMFLGWRALSKPARSLRRRVRPVAARVRFADGGECDLGRAGLLAPVGRGRFVAGAAGVVALVLVLDR